MEFLSAFPLYLLRLFWGGGGKEGKKKGIFLPLLSNPDTPCEKEKKKIINTPYPLMDGATSQEGGEKKKRKRPFHIPFVLIQVSS